jgi:hypothetical protein
VHSHSLKLTFGVSLAEAPQQGHFAFNPRANPSCSKIRLAVGSFRDGSTAQFTSLGCPFLHSKWR